MSCINRDQRGRVWSVMPAHSRRPAALGPARHAQPTPTACRAAMFATVMLGIGQLGVRVQRANRGSSRELMAMLRVRTVERENIRLKVQQFVRTVMQTPTQVYRAPQQRLARATRDTPAKVAPRVAPVLPASTKVCLAMDRVWCARRAKPPVSLQ